MSPPPRSLVASGEARMSVRKARLKNKIESNINLNIINRC